MKIGGLNITNNFMDALRNHIFFLLVLATPLSFVCAQTGSEPNGHCDYEVTKVTATQDGQESGDRHSDEDLKIVKKMSGISLKAYTAGEQAEQEPTWTGFEGCEEFEGQKEANVSPVDKNFTATASACDGEASVKVTFVEPVNIPFQFNSNQTGELGFKGPIANFLNSFSQSNTFNTQGGGHVDLSNVDYYDDGEKIGVKADCQLSMTFGFRDFEWNPPVIPLVYGAGLYMSVNLDTFAATFTAKFKYDDSKENAWPEDITGSLKAGTKLTVRGGAQWGTNAAGVRGSLNATIDIGVTGEVTRTSRDMKAKGDINLGNVTTTFTFSLLLGGTEWTGFAHPLDLAPHGWGKKIPIQEFTFYTLPESTDS